jgi:hypothetical protein
VTVTTFEDTLLAPFLSDLGGSMGLWLGMSIMQLAEIVITVFRGILAKVNPKH